MTDTVGGYTYQIPAEWTRGADGEDGSVNYSWALGSMRMMWQDASSIAPLLSILKAEDLYQMLAESISSSLTSTDENATADVELVTYGQLSGAKLKMKAMNTDARGFLALQDNAIFIMLIADPTKSVEELDSLLEQICGSMSW